MGVNRRAGRGVAIMAVACVVLFSCGGTVSKSSSDGVEVGEGGPDELFAETASFEVVAGRSQRIMVGLSTADGRVLHGGSVEFEFRPSEDGGAGGVTEVIRTTARYLPVPGGKVLSGEAVIGRPSEGIGVYAAADVTIPRAGIWTIDILRPGGSQAPLAQTAVEVMETGKVPNLGDPAPPTDNPTAASSVPRELLDSRSGPNGLGTTLPDAALHRDVINDLLRDNTPFVVVASTPAYCQSRFCGPITDLVDALANEPTITGQGVALVHLEVFARFGGAGATSLNPWVIPWIDGNGNGHEPWVFVVDRTGRIAARYDNLVSEPELRAAIGQVTAR